jgi:DNA-binding transcriptional MerR regulator/effector-binding domain-containing protein
VLSIGEFSKITGLTVKTLRFYHEKEILVPAWIDEQTGYRYYGQQQIDKGRIITQLRGLDFSLEQIGVMLADCNDDARILDFLQQHQTQIEEKVRQYRKIASSLEEIIHQEREGQLAMQHSNFEVEEKDLAAQLVAGIRMKGRYSDCGKGFARLGRTFGRTIAGKPFLLHYDSEYKEEDADFEACMPVGKAKETPGISVRELPGGRCVSLLCKGPYEQLGRSYAKILGYIKDKGYQVVMPTREIYLKGPGMIFKGNPKNYLTEIQMLVKPT